jgi:D-tyrosyl-tRNA(Tyr) deacylase
MKLLVQRVQRGGVEADGLCASIGQGFVVLAGFGVQDALPGRETENAALCRRMLDKLLGLRVFPDERGDMNVDVQTHGGEILVVSQFTLYADCRKGRRPSFHLAAPSAQAKRAYDFFVRELAKRLPGKVQSGCFGADMLVSLINWGPVTIMLDSDDFGHDHGA